MHVPGRAFAATCLLISLFPAPSAARGQSNAAERMTPLLLTVNDAAVPFNASGGLTHLVYELALTNFSSGDVAIQKVEILGDGAPSPDSRAASGSRRLQSAGQRESAATLSKSTLALLLLDIILAQGAPFFTSFRTASRSRRAPRSPANRRSAKAAQPSRSTPQPVVQIAPPLRGERYISADSCCDAVRHTRAAMPINGRAWISQRYAVDWEQLNASGTIYSGPQQKLESYAIFGQPALAVADAVVESVTDGAPEQTPGNIPPTFP